MYFHILILVQILHIEKPLNSEHNTSALVISQTFTEPYVKIKGQQVEYPKQEEE